MPRYGLAWFAAAGILIGLPLVWAGLPGGRFALGFVTAAGGLPIAAATCRRLLSGVFTADTIALLAIAGSFALGEYLAGALVVLMQSGGEALEEYGMRRANRSLDALLRRAPSVASVRHGDTFREISASEVRVGDEILVKPGEIIAADGTVVEGAGGVDEAALTGEPVPLPKQPGDDVYSGTINLSGKLLVRATRPATESKYELIVRMVQRAQGEQAPIHRLADRYAPVFTLLALGMALMALMLTRDPLRGLSILVVATPCPLIIATPLAVLSAINRAASRNIIVKSGAAIESAATVDKVVFDKTGTLTVGRPSLCEIRLLQGAASSGLTETDILTMAASLELLSVHVLAAAVVSEARSRGVELRLAEAVEETPGSGTKGVLDGSRVAIGSAAYLQSIGVPVSGEVEQLARSLSACGRTVAILALEETTRALLAFEDQLRPEAPELIGRLKALGLQECVLLTGDVDETARAVAARAGIADVRARLHPEDKVAAIREMRERQSVMMVGDGINDAPALALASVGVAMGNCGAGIATDVADIVITVEDVGRVADTVEIGRRMVRVAVQGILAGIGASSALMAIAAFGHISPAAGALLQEGLDLAVILNALRAR